MRPRRLKLGLHMDSGQMYHVYQNQAAAAYSSLYFFHFSFSPIFNIEIFGHTFLGNWGLEDWNLVHLWTVGRCIMCTRIRLLLLICPFISSFFFLSNFQHWNFLSHFSQELWGLENWKLIHLWTVGRCIVYTRIRLLLLIGPLISPFSFSNFQTLKFFVHFY